MEISVVAAKGPSQVDFPVLDATTKVLEDFGSHGASTTK